MQKEIEQLKKEKNAVILAHYYQTGDIIDIADMVGDSFALSKQAKETDADIIVFCGVKFMAESAKILSPDKKVLLPAANAGCPMADMVTPQDVRRLRLQYPDAAVVCYVNSSYDVKAECDVCVTSSNAVKIVRAVPQKKVVFVPDQNLANYVAAQVPEKEVIPFSGYCIVHHQMTEDDVTKAKAAVPGALLLVHPECPEAVTAQADFVGSTAQIIDFATVSPEKQFIIGTEMGILHVLEKQNPDKQFFLLSPKLICANMKKTHLADVYEALRHEQHEISLDDAVMNRARQSLIRMLQMG
jgi:quinolinate synthase